MANSYSYDSTKIADSGKDRMRFELGDTMTEGGADTAALTNEEIQAVLEIYPKQWKKAKLALLESLCRRFAYEPDTKTGPLTLSFGGRAKIWREDYENLKAEVEKGSVTMSSVNTLGKKPSPPYFYTGMMSNGEDSL